MADEHMTDHFDMPSQKQPGEPECCFCGESECELRVIDDGIWFGYHDYPPEYVCAECFTGTDTGPCWDDLPEVKP